MFASFRRLGQRDLKRLAKDLHALLNGGAPTDLAGCRELVARLHGHASWSEAQASERLPTWTRARPEVLGEWWKSSHPQAWPHRWFSLSAEEITLPRLVLGATGSGRSEVLINMFKTAVDNGQSGLFLDAKGSTQLQHQLLSYAKEAGRLDDVRVINLLGRQAKVVPASPWWQSEPPHVQSFPSAETHTFNPFERATLDELRAWWMPLWQEALAPLTMQEQADAQAFLDNLMQALVEGRDLGLWPLDVQVMDQALENWEPLVHDVRLDLMTRRRLEKWRGRFILWHADQAALAHARGVLQTLLPYTAFRATVSGRPGEPQWLSADVDWEDMICQRRLVLVLTPPLERMPEHQRFVLDLMTRSLETAFEKVSYRPGECPTHGGMWVFDEVNEYLNEACVNLARRARRLNITVVSGTPSWPRMKRLSDPRLVHRFAEQSGVVVCMRHYDMDDVNEQWPALAPYQSAIQTQSPGEAHVLVRDRLAHLRMSYRPAQKMAGLDLPVVPARWTEPLRRRTT